MLDSTILPTMTDDPNRSHVMTFGRKLTAAERGRILFNVDAAKACTTPLDRVRFVVRLMARNIFIRGVTSEQLCEIWDLSTAYFKTAIQPQANAAFRAILDEGQEDIRGEVLHTMQTVRSHAVAKFHDLEDESPREAQKFLQTALDAAKSIATLLPKQASDGETEVRLVVEVGSTERPKVE